MASKDIYHAHWMGEAIVNDSNLVLFLRLSHDPTRMVVLEVNPTTAKRLDSKVHRFLRKRDEKVDTAPWEESLTRRDR